MGIEGKKRKKDGNGKRSGEALSESATGKPLGGSTEPTQGVGSSLGGTHREDDHESVDGRDFAHQVHRIGQRRLKCFPHKPEPGGYAPPHSSCARRGCEPSGDLIRSQVCVRNVHSFLWL